MSDLVNPPPANFKSGFVTILGAPNVGKSTLLNRLIGEKISITSKKPQTTRKRVRGVLHRHDAQMVFLDTPGIHPAKNLLNKHIVSEALASLNESDVVLFLIDAKKPDPRSENLVLNALEKVSKPVILGINKTDLFKKKALSSLLERWGAVYPFYRILLISAKHGFQIPELVSAMEACLPYGPPFFPEDALTDLPMRFIAAEIVREKIFRFTGQEIPYSIAVTTESFKEDPRTGHVRIDACIHVERDSQKGVIIGKGGRKLKEIGEQARGDIERMVDCPVYLKLFVKVQKNWTKDRKALRRLGYE